MIWDCDYDYEDFGYDGRGIVQVFHCQECGAYIECHVSFDEEDDNVNSEN